jgi:hypothetical protein
VQPDVAVNPGAYLSPDHPYQPESAHLRQAITAFNDLATNGGSADLATIERRSHQCTASERGKSRSSKVSPAHLNSKPPAVNVLCQQN